MESTLVVQALRINTLSKLTFSDSVTFDNLVLDVFPGIRFKDIEFETVADAFCTVCKEQNLIVNETQVCIFCYSNTKNKFPSCPRFSEFLTEMIAFNFEVIELAVKLLTVYIQCLTQQSKIYIFKDSHVKS